jgi:hypothetical protein
MFTETRASLHAVSVILVQVEPTLESSDKF